MVSSGNLIIGAGTTDQTVPLRTRVRRPTSPRALGTDPSGGLTAAEAASRLARYGPNKITGEKPPSILVVALTQLRDPMNIMLIAVTAVSFAIGQVSTGVIVGLLILLNVVLGSRQELKARASVDALSNLQVPQAKVVRGGGLVLVPAVEVVPGDLVQLEAGDIVPADGRIVRSATLEAQEAALTGESAPVSKDSAVLAGDVALGDRSNMLFQNTSVTRGTASMVVTGTGMNTQMGQIATMLTSVTRTRSPLQKELDTLTRVLGIIAWTAVAFIVVVGLMRGMPVSELLLLGTAMAISAIPTGLPAFVSGMLSYGAKQLAAAKAVVKNLTDVETLGATSAINTDKTGTLTMNQMMVSTIYANGSWFTVEGAGLPQDRRRSCRSPAPRSRTSPGWRSGWCWTATPRSPTTGRWSATRPRRRWSCCPPSSVWTRRRPGGRTRGSPRCRSTPSTSSWPPSTTFPVDATDHVIELVKGGPDVVLARCTQSGGPLSGSPGADRAGPRRHRGGERPDGREGFAGPGFRRPAGRGRRDPGDDGRPDVADPRPGVRRHGGHHRPAARRGQGGRGDRAARRDRRPDDHRRPRGHRQGDRRDPRARPRSDQRQRAAGDVRRGTGTPAAAAARLRPGLPGGQAAAGPGHAAARG